MEADDAVGFVYGGFQQAESRGPVVYVEVLQLIVARLRMVEVIGKVPVRHTAENPAAISGRWGWSRSGGLRRGGLGLLGLLRRICRVRCRETGSTGAHYQRQSAQRQSHRTSP